MLLIVILTLESSVYLLSRHCRNAIKIFYLDELRTLKPSLFFKLCLLMNSFCIFKITYNTYLYRKGAIKNMHIKPVVSFALTLFILRYYVSYLQTTVLWITLIFYLIYCFRLLLISYFKSSNNREQTICFRNCCKIFIAMYTSLLVDRYLYKFDKFSKFLWDY